MLFKGKAIIRKCTPKVKKAAKEGQSDFNYFLLNVVGYGFGEELFSLTKVEPTEKEVEITAELKGGKFGYVSHK